MATKAELEERVDVLERRIALVEAKLRGQGRPAPKHRDPDDHDRQRLQHITRILRRLGGSATLDDIARENESITKAGTRAQLVRLIEIGDVVLIKRGVFALK
jgi:glycerol dehydrogenase-like iron-containing ADH family enzyme